MTWSACALLEASVGSGRADAGLRREAARRTTKTAAETATRGGLGTVTKRAC
jgi:hypothetical protein